LWLFVRTASQFIPRWQDNCRQHVTLSDWGLLLSLTYFHKNFNDEMPLILWAKELWTQISYTFMDILYGGQIRNYVWEDKCLQEVTQKEYSQSKMGTSCPYVG
jgi:hypothetical protein